MHFLLSTYSDIDTPMYPSCAVIAHKPKFSCVQFKNLRWCFLLVFHCLQSGTGLHRAAVCQKKIVALEWGGTPIYPVLLSSSSVKVVKQENIS